MASMFYRVNPEWDHIRETPGVEPGYQVNSPYPVGVLRGYLKGKRGTVERVGWKFVKVLINGERWWVRKVDIVEIRE